MAYVVAGYTVVLGILFLYAVQLVWRRRRLLREVAAVEAGPVVAARSAPIGPPASGPPASGPPAGGSPASGRPGGPAGGPAEIR